MEYMNLLTEALRHMICIAADEGRWYTHAQADILRKAIADGEEIHSPKDQCSICDRRREVEQ